ncbi:unnamed protein product [Rangifer tarandus platyrhynchus]|uniref:Uncharacterized protein n=2 Tax=Rangifer tarandus platyrhynchus TaxID=3082113 RepID=A0ABN8YCB5_RANTA|nr:unnamed protein product [Rangifer tarandus platyrhynchus]CAI9695447.1 unnamed protein product [Rangifer tarandus platyrhynchus]
MVLPPNTRRGPVGCSPLRVLWPLPSPPDVDLRPPAYKAGLRRKGQVSHPGSQSGARLPAHSWGLLASGDRPRPDPSLIAAPETRALCPTSAESPTLTPGLYGPSACT